MPIRGLVRKLGTQVLRTESGQSLLAKAVNELDLWRGYGSGASLNTSGEAVLFELLGKRFGASLLKLIFDVGANVGDFSAGAFDALGPEVKIHAFEPASMVCRKLSSRFAGNDRIVINNAALGNEESERPLYGTINDSGMASLLNRNLAHVNMASTFQEMVKVRRLSDYCNSQDIEEIHLLKMDVEGFELEVLAGGQSLFEKGRVRMCSFEFGGCNLDSRTFLRDFFEFFGKFDMEIFRITPAGTLVHLPRYQESLESFATTNYVALNNTSA